MKTPIAILDEGRIDALLAEVKAELMRACAKHKPFPTCHTAIPSSSKNWKNCGTR